MFIRIIFAYFFLFNIFNGYLFAEQNKIKIIGARASTNHEEARKACDGDIKTRWSSAPTDSEWISFILEKKTIIDKVIIYWEAAYGETYQIQVSENGKDWFVANSAIKHKGGKEIINFEPVSARFVRMFGVSRGTQWGYSIFEFEIYASDKEAVPLAKLPKPEEVKYSKSDLTPPAYYYRVAEEAPPGYYPPWLYKKQAYWTITGVPYSREESLFSEYGEIDVCRDGFSLMPYLYLANKLVAAQDSDSTSRGLEDGYLPIPAVIWRYKKLDFVQKVFTYGEKEHSHTCVFYTLKNNSEEAIEGKLFLTIRPFQVNPPWMYGGFAKISHIKKTDDWIYINKQPKILALRKSDKFGAVEYQDGDIIDKIKLGELPQAQEVEASNNFASAAFEYQFKILPNQEEKYLFIVPLGKDPQMPEIISPRKVLSNLNKVKENWMEELNKVEIDIPDKYIMDVFRSNLAYIMINFDDSAFIPGPRNYERSWVRDGSGMAEALLRCGQYEMVKKYLNWLITHQRPTGEIPPILDNDGKPQGEKEYDNQGEFLFVACEYYRFTRDKEFLNEIFPSVVLAAKFIEELKSQRTTDEYKNTRFFGILPISISHEGFPPPGAHSYWDDWWALKGLKDAIYLASELEKQNEVSWLKKLEEELRQSLLRSIALTMKEKNMTSIPSSAEGHEDACGNAIAIWPTEENSFLPKDAMLSVLDKWYENVFLRERKMVIKNNFTPYEIRIISAYLVMEQRKKALDMLEFFLSVTRPKEWNQWAECVTKTYREPTYLGDMPHGWVSAIYMNVIRNMFACEYDNGLLLGLGIDGKWLNGKTGVAVRRLPTHYGKLNYTVRSIENNVLEIKISKLKDMPQNAITFISPLELPIKSVKYNGEEWNKYSKDRIFIDELPAKILVSY